jgi:hypothetical protein
MKIKQLIYRITLITMMVLLPTAAFSWGSAVHAYIDGKLATKWKLLNGNQDYGAMVPDAFNFSFDQPAYMGFLYAQTHMNFLHVWYDAESRPAKALAFGFVSHNDVWGADFTAHHSGITSGQGKGYIIAKAEILKVILESIPDYAALNIPDAVSMEIAHNLVESAVDILMKHVDPRIGQKMIAAALPPHPNMPLLLVKAYAGDLAGFAGIREHEAAKFIVASEKQFRKITILYGQALTLDDADAVQALAEQLADFAQAFLAAYGVTLLPGTDLTPLLEFGISQGMLLCAADFAQEVVATAAFVNQQLDMHGISY